MHVAIVSSLDFRVKFDFVTNCDVDTVFASINGNLQSGREYANIFSRHNTRRQSKAFEA